VLDLGCGGSDTGAVNKQHNLEESEEVLQGARHLEDLLMAGGYATTRRRCIGSGRKIRILSIHFWGAP